ncbi:MAG TPA: T9SS type A sorting domain-containing protein, partial [Aequorivita sp.]|nr:T9SS type A sorting domain-containing protein [Aequorivita sp.]
LGMVSGEMDCSAFDQSFIYPEDQWFRITCIYDLDNQVWDMFIDEIQFVFDQPFAFGSQVFVELAAFDFYSVSANNEMYIDDVVLGSPQIGVQDFTINRFSVYPNPAKDVLNIKSSTVIDNVVIYDFLGRVVLHQNPGTISPTINMTNLASGSYLVKVTIGDSSKTVKILK